MSRNRKLAVVRGGRSSLPYSLSAGKAIGDVGAGGGSGDSMWRRYITKGIMDGVQWCQRAGRPFNMGSTWIPTGTDTYDWLRICEAGFQTIAEHGARCTLWTLGDWVGNGSYNETIYYTAGVTLNTRREPAASLYERFMPRSGDMPWGFHWSGGEFGAPTGAPATTAAFCNGNPGTYDSDYHYNSLASAQYVARQAPHCVLSLAYRWERLQPTLSAALNATEAGRIDTALGNISSAGLRSTLMMFNYAAYYSGVSSGTRNFIGSSGCTLEDWQDAYWRIASRWKTQAGLFSYTLMDEPGSGSAPSGGCRRTTVIDALDSSVAGWASEETTTGLALDTTLKKVGAGSLKFTRDFGGAGYGQVRIGRSVSLGTGTFNVRAWVYLPAAAGGTDGDWHASFYSYDSTGNVEPALGMRYTRLYKGQWNLVCGTLTVSTITTLGIQIFCNSSGGSVQINIDDVYQGAATRGTLWEWISQLAVTAIRATGDTHRIAVQWWGEFVGGLPHPYGVPGSWHEAFDFISDSADNYEYEGHWFPDLVADTGGSIAYDTNVAAAQDQGW